MEASHWYLPSCQAHLAQQVAAGLDTSVFIPVGANLTQLEGAPDVAVELILLLLWWKQTKTFVLNFHC